MDGLGVRATESESLQSNKIMAERGTTSDCTKQKQKQHLGIAKLKLPTLAVAGSGSSLKPHFDDAEPFHFELIRSEANKGSPPLLAALFSNGFFRIPGTYREKGSRPNLLIQNNPAAGFILKYPLVAMLAGLFSEIKQELSMEARKFSVIQSEYLKECMRRSRKPAGAAIYRNNITPPTDDTANTTRVLKFKNDMSFLVRFFFEIMEGWDSEGIKKKAACDMPSLPDIYYSSTNEPKASADTSEKRLEDSSSFNNKPNISGFNTLFNLASKRKY